MTTKQSEQPAVWIPIVFTLGIVAMIVFKDWNRHEFVSIASLSRANHPAGLRYAIHSGTVVVLGLLAFLRPARLIPVWVIGAVLIGINALATARLVMTTQEGPYVAVAGYEIDRVELRYDKGSRYHAASVCYDSFSRTDRAAEIDGKTLAPPFLPLPVEWSEVDMIVLELACISS